MHKVNNDKRSNLLKSGKFAQRGLSVSSSTPVADTGMTSNWGTVGREAHADSMGTGRQLACTVDRSVTDEATSSGVVVAPPTAKARRNARLHSNRNSPTRRRKSLERTPVETTYATPASDRPSRGGLVQAVYRGRTAFGNSRLLWDDRQDRVLLDCIVFVTSFSDREIDMEALHQEWKIQEHRGLVPPRSKNALRLRINGKHWSTGNGEGLREAPTETGSVPCPQTQTAEPDSPPGSIKEFDGKKKKARKRKRREKGLATDIGENKIMGRTAWETGLPKRRKADGRDRSGLEEVTPFREENTPIVGGFDDGLLWDTLDGDPEVANEEAEGARESTRETLFESFFRANISKATRLIPRKPRRMPKKVDLQWLDKMVRDKIAAKSSIIVVTAALYAGAKVFEEEHNDRFVCAQKSWVEHLGKVANQRRELVEEKKAISRELRRRKLQRGLNEDAYRTVKGLKENGSVKTKSLKDRIVGIDEKINVLDHNCDVRRKLRAAKNRRTPATRTILQKSCNGVVDCSAEEVRNVWAKIIGKEGPRIKIPKEIEDWKDEVRADGSTRTKVPKALWRSWWNISMKSVKSWKAPGPDGVHAFYWKMVPAAREFLCKWVKGKVLIGKKEVPRQVSAGRVVMIPKKGSSTKPEDMRPIACLNVSCKVLNAMIWKVSEENLTKMIPEEQRALRKQECNTLHAHIIDSGVATDFRYRKSPKEVHIAWVDYAKAFDSVSHKYLKWLLRQVGIRASARRTYFSFLQNLTVYYEVRTENGTERSTPLQYRRGVPQGDTLSPRLFCLALAPISHALRKAMQGYTFAFKRESEPTQLTHLLYVDDLKLFSQDSEQLRMGLQLVKRLSEVVGLQYNQKKCSTAHFGGASNAFEEVPVLEYGEVYRYLGIEQHLGTGVEEVRGRVHKTIMERVDRIWESEMTFPEKVHMFNMTVAPVARFYAGNHCATGGERSASNRAWGTELDKEIRKIMATKNARFSKCSKYRPYLPISELGLGLKSLADEVDEATVYAACYLLLTPSLKMFKEIAETHARRGKRTLISDFAWTLQQYAELDVDFSSNGRIRVGEQSFTSARAASRVLVQLMRQHQVANRLEAWKKKTASSSINTADIDKGLSGNWVRACHLDAKVVRDAMGLQEHQVLFNGHPKNGFGKCRFCEEKETCQHVVSVCSTFRASLMVKRHDAVCRVIYDRIRKELKMERLPNNWTPPPLYQAENGTQLYWNHIFHTRAVLRYRRPDMVVVIPERKTILIIEVAVSWVSRLDETTKWKFAKYAHDGNAESRLPPYQFGPALATDLQYSRGFRVEVIPIAIGTCGEVHTSFTDYFKKIPGCQTPKQRQSLLTQIQKRVIRGTVGIMRAHLAHLSR
uniref:Reverse transcriptase domain-containing protein n=1 Tax=Caenorhabditis japonica TaxID=281687 RepID=A0A8R1EL94_CAEJA